MSETPERFDSHVEPEATPQLPRLFSEQAQEPLPEPPAVEGAGGGVAADGALEGEAAPGSGRSSGSWEIDPPLERPEIAERRPWGADVGAARGARRRTRRRVRRTDRVGRVQFTGEQRLLVLDSWVRSKLSAQDFAPLVGISAHTLYGWKRRFELEGPAALENKPKGAPKGSRLPEPTRRAILMLKEQHPEWGEERIHQMLQRTQGLGASPGAIGRVLNEGGWQVQEGPSRPHPPKPTRFERARPNQLWQTDLFTFVLKREGRRVYLVAFMDDHSRFVVGYGLHASASSALVREVYEAAIANYGAPDEALTDNGTQYHTWRGTSAFKRLCERRGIRQIVASPRHPQTLGKIERFWGTLWRECVERAIFQGLDDARRRIGLFIDHYNFQRTHSGIGGLVPADRFFAAAPQVLETLRRRVRSNALELARNGTPRKPFYLTGRVGDTAISLHAEGEKVVLMREDGEREEVDLSAPGQRGEEGEEHEVPEPLARHAAPPDLPGAEDDSNEIAPGASPLDSVLERLEERLCGDAQEREEPS